MQQEHVAPCSGVGLPGLTSCLAESQMLRIFCVPRVLLGMWRWDLHHPVEVLLGSGESFMPNAELSGHLLTIL
jgi:hypothetical protein